MKEYQITVLKGDGIGPEIVDQAIKVLNKTAEKFDFKVNYQEEYIGGAAIDVFAQEPEKNGPYFNNVLQGKPNIILTPHIGGSTTEAQQHIGDDVSQKIINFIETGASVGSKSIPELNLPQQEKTHRILHIHNNVPGVMSSINSALSLENMNINAQYLKTNEDVGYVVIDIDENISEQAFHILNQNTETIKIRRVF